MTAKVLREYERKRRFDRTPEPQGTSTPEAAWSFVVQKHAARNLHYDFRLELDGVLKSWAVPKGPSLDPTVKRLAVEVEDHPVAYGSFEGTIPHGQYGAGSVMVWDCGTWEPIGDPHDSFRDGMIKFNLHGVKLRGKWVLVRTRSQEGKQHWLLIKERDVEAKPERTINVLEAMPFSVCTGRSIAEIGAQPAKGTTTNGRLPARIEVQMPTKAKKVPDGPEWLHEVQLDGYRSICRIDHGRARFLTPDHRDSSRRLAALVSAVQRLPVRQAILDGEVVSLRPDGRADIEQLREALKHPGSGALHYFVSDLLFLDGSDLRDLPLQERKRSLADLLRRSVVPDIVRLSEHLEGNGPEFFSQACRMHLAGIVSKRRDRAYRPGRNRDWLTVKCDPAHVRAKRPTHKKKNTPLPVGYDRRSQKFDGVRLTSPEKGLYPEDGITKLDLANYYRMVADWMLPHVADRPLAIVRCPEGLAGEQFFQKHPPAGASEAFRRVPVPEDDGETKDHLAIHDAKGLTAIAQISGLEVHSWGARADDIERPDRLVFDLDPDPELPWTRTVRAAHMIRQFLADLGLETFVKSTGGKGLHLVVPIVRRHDWPEVRDFCKRVADAIVAGDPKHFTANLSKAARPGKIFIDYLRNVRGASAVAAYSTRARLGAPVSAPLSWDELDAHLRSDHFTVRNLGKRLATLKADPWEGIAKVRQSLAGASGILDSVTRT